MSSIASITVNGGGAQRSRVTSLRVVFDSAVNLPKDYFRLALRPNVTVSGVPREEYGILPQSLELKAVDAGTTWDVLPKGNTEFGSLQDGVYQLCVGEVPVATFHRLFGDIDGSKSVNTSDTGPFGLAFLSSEGDPNYVAAFDYNQDGSIDGEDQKRLNLNTFVVLSY
jgi:hypothetical protein